MHIYLSPPTSVRHVLLFRFPLADDVSIKRSLVQSLFLDMILYTLSCRDYLGLFFYSFGVDVMGDYIIFSVISMHAYQTLHLQI